MEPDEYREQLLHVYIVVKFLARMPLAEMQDAQRYAETIGPFLDPTAYMRNMPAFREDCAAVDALAGAKARLLRDFPQLLAEPKTDDAEPINLDPDAPDSDP